MAFIQPFALPPTNCASPYASIRAVSRKPMMSAAQPSDVSKTSLDAHGMKRLFQKHMQAELDGDLNTTMDTMGANPHLNHVPVMAGGTGRQGVRDFYKNHLVGKFFPPDIKFHEVSTTVGGNQIVQEMVLEFTHTTMIDWMLPEVKPTNKKVEIAIVVIIGFEGDKVKHEHIYWDQASVLVQLGLLNPENLPVSGAESARKVLDPNLPSRVIPRS